MELRFAEALGYDVQILEGYEFGRSDDLFQAFVSKFYNIRLAAKKAGNKALEQVAKLMINSAYGRFALGTDPG